MLLNCVISSSLGDTSATSSAPNAFYLPHFLANQLYDFIRFRLKQDWQKITLSGRKENDSQSCLFFIYARKMSMSVDHVGARILSVCVRVYHIFSHVAHTHSTYAHEYACVCVWEREILIVSRCCVMSCYENNITRHKPLLRRHSFTNQPVN